MFVFIKPIAVKSKSIQYWSDSYGFFSNYIKIYFDVQI